MFTKSKIAILVLLTIVSVAKSLYSAPYLPLYSLNNYGFRYNSGWGPRSAGVVDATEFHRGFDITLLKGTVVNGNYQPIESYNLCAPWRRGQ